MTMVKDRSDPDEADWGPSAPGPKEPEREPEGRNKASKEILWKLLEICGWVTFHALEFMFYYMVGFIAVMIGFVRANRKGGRK